MSLYNVLKSANNGEKRVIETKTPVVPLVEDASPSPEALAKQMIHDARMESEKLRQEIELERESTIRHLEMQKKQWVQEREEERKTAKEAGYNEGLTNGSETAKTLWAERLNEAKNIVISAETDYKKYLEQSEEDILNLSLAIAGRIVSEVLVKEPTSWMTLVKNAIKEVRDQETIKIMVAPSKFTEVLEGKEEIQTVSRDARLQIFPDETLGENDCFIETAYGRIDASVDQQFLVIKQALKEILEAGMDEGKGSN